MFDFQGRGISRRELMKLSAAGVGGASLSGWLGLLALIYLGGGLLGRVIFPPIDLFNSVLVRL